MGAWSILAPSTRFLISEMGREAREGWPLGALYANLLALSLQTDLIKNHSSEQIAFPLLKGRLGVIKAKEGDGVYVGESCCGYRPRTNRKRIGNEFIALRP